MSCLYPNCGCPGNWDCEEEPFKWEPLDQWEDDGGPTWPVYEEAKGG